MSPRQGDGPNRHKKGTPQGGRFAPGQRPTDPPADEALRVADRVTSPTSDTIEVTLPNGIPICIERHDGVWDVEETWPVTDVGLSVSHASSNPTESWSSSKRALEGLLRGHAVAQMLNHDELGPDDAGPLLERLGSDWGTGDPARKLTSTDSSPEALWGAVWVAASLGQLALRRLHRLWPQPASYQPRDNWERLSLRVRDAGARDESEIPALMRSVERARTPEMLASRFAGDLDRLWEACELDRTFSADSHQPITLKHLTARTGLGARFGTPDAVARIFDRLDRAAGDTASSPTDRWLENWGEAPRWGPWLRESERGADERRHEEFPASRSVHL